MTNTTTPTKTTTTPAAKPVNVDPASTPERKLVEKRRAAGGSWAAIAKDLGTSPMGVRGRYIDLVPVK